MKRLTPPQRRRRSAELAFEAADTAATYLLSASAYFVDAEDEVAAAVYRWLADGVERDVADKAITIAPIIAYARPNGAGELVFRQAGHPSVDEQLVAEGWLPLYAATDTTAGCTKPSPSPRTSES